jgi:hypothetical protein
MLDTTHGFGQLQLQYLITEDKFWIYWHNHYRGIWAVDRDEIQHNSKHIILSKKAMVSAYFCCSVVVSIEFLPDGQKDNLVFVTETVLPSIERKLAECRPKLRATAAQLHIDNAIPHKSKISIEKSEELVFIRVHHPDYSPDAEPYDFFLFGCLKHKLEGKTFRSEAEVISTVRQILLEIPIQVLRTMMDKWKSRLKQCISLGGEYLLYLKNEIQKISHIRRIRINCPDFWTTVFFRTSCKNSTGRPRFCTVALTTSPQPRGSSRAPKWVHAAGVMNLPTIGDLDKAFLESLR